VVNGVAYGNTNSDGSTYSSGLGAGTTGFAKAFTDAIKAGLSYSAAEKAATVATGGSGITLEGAQKIAAGSSHSMGSFRLGANGYIENIPDVSTSTAQVSRPVSLDGAQEDTSGQIGSEVNSGEGRTLGSLFPSDPSTIKIGNTGNFSNYLVFGALVLLVIKLVSRGK
jgi:hypothetical protein